MRPTRACINLSAVEHNFYRIKERLSKDTRILAVVKRDAYGHGAVKISKTLEKLGCDMLGVALCEEAIELRKSGVSSPIIILSGIYEAQLEDIIRYDLTPVIFDIGLARGLNYLLEKMGKRLKVHIKIDTGMGRLGVLPHAIPAFFNEMKRFVNLSIDGMLSHFAEADVEDKEFTESQLQRFKEGIETIKEMGIDPTFKHIANSAAIIDLSASYFNLVRPGIMLYGSYPSEGFRDKIYLLPVMDFTTEIIQLKWVPPGYPVSYGRTFIAEKDSLIATIPVGYGDGYPRSISNKADVLVNGKRAPVVGRICMDMTMLDVTDIQDVKVGDEVVLIGRQKEEEITAEELADKANTISYEIFCGINNRVPRVYRES